ncbi:unnamed protein product, partial [Amoebophrya sp. A25]
VPWFLRLRKRAQSRISARKRCFEMFYYVGYVLKIKWLRKNPWVQNCLAEFREWKAEIARRWDNVAKFVLIIRWLTRVIRRRRGIRIIVIRVRGKTVIRREVEGKSPTILVDHSCISSRRISGKTASSPGAGSVA